jgi:Plasmid encoded RepA protein
VSQVGTVHSLIEAKGRLGALGHDVDRRTIETAAAYMADEDNGIGFVYSGWAQAALPHRRLKDDQTWQITSDRVKLLIEPGRRATDIGDPIWVGVPYGSRARLIMLYLQTEALRTNSREIELGKSLRDWLSRLGIPIGGKSLKDVREQAERISRCRLTFHVQTAGRSGLVNQNIMDTAMFVDGADPAQGSLFLETARLSETFYEQLRKHPVPLEEAAIRAINNNSMALDLYCWLAYRLHVLTGPRPVTWKALMGQFGAGYKEQFHFKPRFLENLELALAVYRDAKVDVDERGLVLRPSRPPVPPRHTVTTGR